jgi:hypothetical protein
VGKGLYSFLTYESKWRQVLCPFTAGEEHPVPNGYGYRCIPDPILTFLSKKIFCPVGIRKPEWGNAYFSALEEMADDLFCCAYRLKSG